MLNKRAFIDFDEINPFAILLAFLGGIFAFVITGNPFGFGGEEALVNSVSMFWRIASGVLTFVIGFFIVQAMSE